MGTVGFEHVGRPDPARPRRGALRGSRLRRYVRPGSGASLPAHGRAARRRVAVDARCARRCRCDRGLPGQGTPGQGRVRRSALGGGERPRRSPPAGRLRRRHDAPPDQEPHPGPGSATPSICRSKAGHDLTTHLPRAATRAPVHPAPRHGPGTPHPALSLEHGTQPWPSREGMMPLAAAGNRAATGIMWS